MKKLLSLILVTFLMFTMCSGAFAQTMESPLWGIKFNLSDSWEPVYSNQDIIKYVYSTDSSEEIVIDYGNMGVGYTIRSFQSNIDSTLDGWLSDSTLADGLSKANEKVDVTVTENYHNRRFETYNGVEYYRAEKSYLAKASGYNDQEFYVTYFFTIHNNKQYAIMYRCKGSNAPHFADVTAMLDSMRYADSSGSFNRIGDNIGSALKTDIKATINGHQIPSFNVDGYTYIVAEDLRYYGFSVNYDDPSRSLSLSRDFSQSWVSKDYAKPYVSPDQVGQAEHSILYTDIKTYLDGSYTQSHNINGQTIIRFDSLAKYGNVAYDDNLREISLSLPGIN